MIGETELLQLLGDLESFRVERTVSTTDTAKFSEAVCAFANSRPVKTYSRWMDKIPPVYREHILNEALPDPLPTVAGDPHCLAQLKHYRSLMPLAMEAHKPMFDLKPADGAIGAHVEAVRQCRADFLRLATAIAASAGIAIPT